MSAQDPEQTCPLLEYDPDPTDVVTAALPTPRKAAPAAAVFAWLGGATHAWADGHGYRRLTSIDLIGQSCVVYVGHHPVPPQRHGEVDAASEPPPAPREVALVDMPVGAPAAAIVADNVFRRGARTVVGVGSCGGLVHFAEGDFVLPTMALRDEGTSWHYAPPSRWIATDPEVRAALAAACARAGYGAAHVPVWTTDAFYRETRAKVEARRAEGCQVVDMECSAMAAVAHHRGARYAQLLFTADTLAGAAHDVRGWGRSVHETALRLALDAVAAVAPVAG